MNMRLSAAAMVGSAVLLGSAGCNHCEKCQCFDTANQRTLDQIDKTLDTPQDHWTDMTDNAILHDMTVADLHFVPHTAEISGTGAARLDRMAALLDAYGGTVRYETYVTDEALIKKRLEHVKEYLTTTGCEMARVDIKAMISGGTGMSANKAILIDIKGTGNPAAAAGGGPSLGAPAAPPQGQ